MRKTTLIIVSVLVLLTAPQSGLAVANVSGEPPFTETVFSAEVISIESSGEHVLPGVGLTQAYQMLTVRITQGARQGELVTLENNSPNTLSVGERFFLHRSVNPDGSEMWAVGEPNRIPVLLALTAIFVLVTVLAAGVPGARSLIALVGSFFIIIFGLLPLLSSGAPPALTSITLAVLVLAFSMFVTHGLDKKTFVALLGSVVALMCAAFLAELSVRLARLSGFVSDETVFLNFAASGGLDLPGLLLGGILIGIVGVLNDVSVSQVHTVAELHEANPTLSRLSVLSRAMRVGREHLGAVVNTLPLAYAGASLPLLLLFSYSDAPFWFIVNREIFSAEIIRTLAGGIGLMGSGVIATVLAVFTLIPPGPRATMREHTK